MGRYRAGAVMDTTEGGGTGWSCGGGGKNCAVWGGTLLLVEQGGPAGTKKEEWSHGLGALVRLP